jgi:hypothetical protein
MKFNVSKCKVMHLGKRNPKFDYEMDGVRLEEVEEERDIGVMVSNTLKLSKQCAKAAAAARVVLGQITRAFHFRYKVTFVRLFKTYVRPHLEFCTPSWAPWTQADRDCLEKVQIKMVSMISGLQSDIYVDRLAEIGLDSLQERQTWYK